MLAIIDADSIGYSIASKIWKEQIDNPKYVHTEQDYFDAIDLFLDGIIQDSGASESELWLTPKKSFRKILVPEYKSNRKGKEKPPMLGDVVSVMVERFGAKYADSGFEADDEVGQTALDFWKDGKEDSCIICSIDKDLDTIPGWHYRWGLFNKEAKRYFIMQEQAMHFYYVQVLAGDPGDGIKGIPGIGPKKAEQILKGCLDEEEYEDACRNAYQQQLSVKLSKDECEEYLAKTMELLKIGKERKEYVHDIIGTD